MIENTNIRELLYKGKIVSCNRDIKDCFTEPELDALFHEMDIKHKYFLGITENYSVDGIFLIFIRNGIRLEDKNFAETFIQQCSLVLHRKKMEEKLIIEKERAEESDKLKTSFLANLSHEIRTPINAIQGFSELLKIEDVSLDKKREYIDIIQEKSNQLIQIIADIIDIIRMFEPNLKCSSSVILL